ncbi:MAG: hypothetical protein ABIJ47_10885 [Candidatus Bathyarchaeota archaeon]
MRPAYQCPGCGRILLYLGKRRYTCTNPGCRVKLVAVTNLGSVRIKEAEA